MRKKDTYGNIMNNNTPTLNIKDLAQLKSNPKDFYKKHFNARKTHYTQDQILNAWDNYTEEAKQTLMKYAIPDHDPEMYEKMSKEDQWEYAKQVFDNVPKKKRDNIVQYLTDFDESDYMEDDMSHIPTEREFEDFLDDVVIEEADAGEIRPQDIEDGKIDPIDLNWQGYASGTWEKGQIEEEHDKIQSDYWKEQDNMKYRDFLDLYYNDFLADNDRDSWFNRNVRGERSSQYSEELDKRLHNTIKENPPLQTNTVMYTTDLFIDGKDEVGRVKPLDYYCGLHYNEESAETGGINHLTDYKEGVRYKFEIYSDKGTEGLTTSNHLAEHQFIPDKNQKLIIMEVDNSNFTGKAKLITEPTRGTRGTRDIDDSIDDKINRPRT